MEKADLYFFQNINIISYAIKFLNSRKKVKSHFTSKQILTVFLENKNMQLTQNNAIIT